MPFYHDSLPAEVWPTEDGRFPEWHPFIGHAIKVADKYQKFGWSATDSFDGFFELAWGEYLMENHYQFYLQVCQTVNIETAFSTGCSRSGDSPGMPGYGWVDLPFDAQVTFGYDWVNPGDDGVPEKFFIQWMEHVQSDMDFVLIPVEDVTLELVVACIQHMAAKHDVQYVADNN